MVKIGEKKKEEKRLVDIKRGGGGGKPYLRKGASDNEEWKGYMVSRAEVVLPPRAATAAAAGEGHKASTAVL